MSPNTSMATPETAVRTSVLVRALIYTLLLIFAVYYLLKTKQRTKGDQTWFVFDPMDAGPNDASGNPTTLWVPTKADYDRGLELSRALELGEVGLAQEEVEEPATGGTAQCDSF